MKKILTIIITTALLTGSLLACTNAKEDTGAQVSNVREATVSETENEKTQDKPLQIVATIFPEYDWVKNILGDKADNAELTMLLDNGVDLHSYQPTAKDILKIGSCDLFIYVGGESDEWVDDALLETTNKDMVVINLLEELGDSVKEEEVVEGMQEEEHEHEYDGDEHHDENEDEHEHEEEEVEYDEHVWLSLKNTAVLCDSIADALKKIDPSNADVYQANVDSYKEKLSELDTKYADTVNSAEKKTILFGDRFPFRYLVDDYGLDYYAAFVGCSAETEASFETIVFLAGKVDELGLNTVLTIENSDHRIAEAIIQSGTSKDQQILTMDSLQSVTSNDVANGVSYLSVMENNLSVLSDALK